MSSTTDLKTVTAIQNADTGIITAFFTKLPGLVVQGKSIDDVSKKLKIALNAYIARLESIGSEEFQIKTQVI